MCMEFVRKALCPCGDTFMHVIRRCVVRQTLRLAQHKVAVPCKNMYSSWPMGKNQTSRQSSTWLKVPNCDSADCIRRLDQIAFAFAFILTTLVGGISWATWPSFNELELHRSLFGLFGLFGLQVLSHQRFRPQEPQIEL